MPDGEGLKCHLEDSQALLMNNFLWEWEANSQVKGMEKQS